MRREKGSFRKGRKIGARPNFHNFRSSSNPVIVDRTVKIIEPPAPEPKIKEVPKEVKKAVNHKKGKGKENNG